MFRTSHIDQDMGYAPLGEVMEREESGWKKKIVNFSSFLLQLNSYVEFITQDEQFICQLLDLWWIFSGFASHAQAHLLIKLKGIFINYITSQGGNV